MRMKTRRNAASEIPSQAGERADGARAAGRVGRADGRQAAGGVSRGAARVGQQYARVAQGESHGRGRNVAQGARSGVRVGARAARSGAQRSGAHAGMLPNAAGAYAQARKQQIARNKVFALLAAIVALLTAWALMQPASAWIQSTSEAPESTTLPAADYALALNEVSEGDVSAVQVGVKSISLPADEKVVLGVDESLSGATYQWQMFDPDANAWADVYGDVAQVCSIYNAKVVNALSDNETVLVRAVVEQGDAQYATDTVEVSLAAESASEQVSESEPVVQVSTAAEIASAQAPSLIATGYGTATLASYDAGVSVKGTSGNGDDAGLVTLANDDEDDDDSGDANDGANGNEGTDANEGEGSEDDSDQTSTRYTVRVRYLYEDGSQAADPWWATFSATGETGSYEVTFPEIAGYEVKEVTSGDGSNPIVGSNSLFLPEKINSNITYNVVYTAAEVGYTVNHYLQDLGSDTYTLHETEEKKALTGSLVTDAAKKYEGFTVVAYAYPTVAGDGSTVINIYYDRNYYKFTFELSGGTGIADLYVQYGATLPSLNDAKPTRVGYVFAGWYADEGYKTAVSELPATMPAENKTYYAKWSDGESTYTVVVWTENLDGTYSYLTGYKGIKATTNSSVDVSSSDVEKTLKELESNEDYSEIAYFSINTEKSDEGVRVAGDGSSTVNVYYDRSEYTLRFVYARSYTSYGKATYQMSISNNGYSMHSATLASGEWKETTGATQSYAYDISYGCHWVDLNSEPSISSEYQAIINGSNGVLTTGSYEFTSNSTTRTYYYIDLTAKYGADIYEYWPQSGSVTALYGNGSTYSLIDWGTEYGSLYQETYGATEPNIHPYYSTLDKYLIADPSAITTSSNRVPAHTLVGYTSNNTIFHWDYVYYYEALQSEIDDPDTTTEEHNGKQYVAGGTVDVYTTQVKHDLGNVAVVGINGFVTPSSANNTLVLGADNPPADSTVTTGYELNLYYDRERYNISFYNGYDGTKKASEIPYGESLSSYMTEIFAGHGNDELDSEGQQLLAKVKPLTVQADASWDSKWEFSGIWYTGWNETSKTVLEGTKFDFDSATMPQSNLLLYAEWVPKTYTATFFWESPDSNTAGAGVVYDELDQTPQTFDYGTTLTYPGTPEYGSYEFLYWTYYVFTRDYVTDCEIAEGKFLTFAAGDTLHFPSGISSSIANTIIKGLLELEDCPIEERRLSFDTTVFYEDVYIYGHWNSIVYIPYTVHYVLLDEGIGDDAEVASIDESGIAYNKDGERIGIQIADDTEGSRLAGITVTETAKMGDALYADYQGLDENGLACYPVGSSTHSLEMDIMEKSIEYTFVYKKANPVTYRVQYLEITYDENGKPLKDENGDLVTKELEPSIDFNSTQAIVTKDAPVFSGYTLVADPVTGEFSYQVTRVLSYAEKGVVTDENTITFYYVKDDRAKTYTIKYYVQNLDGNYIPYTDMVLTGAVDTKYNAAELTIPGYWLDKSVDGTVPGGMLTAEADLVLKLYYSAYPLTVTKVWDEGVKNDDRDPVTIQIYVADKERNVSGGSLTEFVLGSTGGDNASENTDANTWTKTIYLPLLEERDEDTGVVASTGEFYAVVEKDALAAAYSDGTNSAASSIATSVNLNGKSVTAGEVTLTQGGSIVVVTNYPTYELPNTGGVGTSLYTLGGFALVAAALLCGLVTRRRQEGRDAK